MEYEYTDMGLEVLLKGFKKLDASGVEVGVVGDAAAKPSADGRLTLGELAIINELGSRNMHVPARPFVGGAISDIKAMTVAQQVMDELTSNPSNADAEKALSHAGQHLAMIMIDGVLRGRFKPNAESTIKQKGFDHPLIDTSHLVDAIGYKVVKKSTAGEAQEMGIAHSDTTESPGEAGSFSAFDG